MTPPPNSLAIERPARTNCAIPLLRAAIRCAGAFVSLSLASVYAGPDAAASTTTRYRIETIAGESFEAADLEIADKRLQATVEGGPRAVRLSEIAGIHVKHTLTQRNAPAAGAQPSDAVITLVDGSVLSGVVEPPSDQAPGAFAFDPAWRDPLSIPFTAVAGIRFRRTDAADFDQRLARREPGRDVLLLARDGNVLAVPGAVESLAADQCEFRVGRKLQTAPIHSLVGIVFGSQAPRHKPPARTTLQDGDSIAGTLVAIRADRVLVASELIGQIDLPLSIVQRIDLSSARVVSLVDLTPVTSQIRSVLDATWTVGRNANLRGQPLMIRGQIFPRGLGVHAYTLLAYDLSDSYERFSTTIGIDESAPERASVVFRIKLDGRVAYESPVLRRRDAPLPVNVRLVGARLLELECDPTDDLDFGDHAVWGEPILVKPRTADERSDD